MKLSKVVLLIDMIMGGSAGLRLSLDELLFLCAGIGASHLFGIKDGARDVSPAGLAGQWQEVKNSLLQKPFATLEGDTLRITSYLAEVIDVISHPNFFLVATHRLNGKDVVRNYYFSNKRVVRLVAEQVQQQSYFLTPFSNAGELEVDIQSFMELSDKEYLPETLPVSLAPDRFNDYMEAVLANDSSKQQELMGNTHIPVYLIEDLGRALLKREHMSSILGMKIDGAQSKQTEFLIYAACEYLWQIDLQPDRVNISACGSHEYRSRISHIAYLFNCF